MSQEQASVCTISSAAALWAAYWQNPTDERRNALIVHYLPLVKLNADHLSRRTRGMTLPAIDHDDLMQYGILGLKDAIRSFDPERGAKFETYCYRRVRGAMLDGIKSLQWVPRDLRQKINRFSETCQTIEMEEGAAPADEVVAGRMGVCPQSIRRLEQDAAGMNVLSLSGGASHDDEHPRPADLVPDHREASAVDRVQLSDVKELFLRELTQAERLLMMLYYYEDMTMREVGATLGISGTRVSQMHSDIVARLREKLEGRVLGKHSGRALAVDV